MEQSFNQAWGDPNTVAFVIVMLVLVVGGFWVYKIVQFAVGWAAQEQHREEPAREDDKDAWFANAQRELNQEEAARIIQPLPVRKTGQTIPYPPARKTTRKL